MKVKSHEMRVPFAVHARTPLVAHILKKNASRKLLLMATWSFKLDVCYRSFEVNAL